MADQRCAHHDGCAYRIPSREGTISIAVLKLGLHDTVGVLVAGREREQFPTDIERLLLQVSTNLAAIALQEARHASDQRRTTEALEREVTKRTAELTHGQ